MYINTILGIPKVNESMVLKKFICGVNPMLCPKRWQTINVVTPQNIESIAESMGCLRFP